MTIKRKDFQKTAAYMQEFLLKLNEDCECAELRDALNLALLHMQRYYRSLQHRLQDNKNNSSLARSSLRGLSPMTPFRDAPDKFVWKWLDLDSRRVSLSSENGLSYGNLALILQAAKAGDESLVREIVAKDQNHLYDSDALGRTALMYAVKYEHTDIVRWLINMGADPCHAAHDGSTALHRASHDSLSASLRILLQSGCDVQPQDVYGRAPIHWSVITEQTECLQILMEYGANVNIRDKDGLSPSMWACRMDNIEHFQLLSQVENQDIQEADGIERDNSGRTWMHWAVRRTEPLECLQTLLTEETAPIKDDDGKTVLLLAAESGSLAACRLILEIAGDDCIKDRDDQDRSALHLSVNGGHGEVVNFLLDKGADLESQDKYNATPLEYARARQLHYCQLILSSHIRQRAREGRTPESTLASLSRETSGVFDVLSKPITPPHPPRLPPPVTPRKMKRSVRSQSLSRSESFDQGRDVLMHIRSRSLDVQDYRELRDITNMFPEENAFGEKPGLDSQQSMDSEPSAPAVPPPTARDERPRTSRGPGPRQRTPRSPPEAPNRKEPRREAPPVRQVMNMEPPAPAEVVTVMRTPRSDEEGHLSMGEMEVSDIDGDGDESDQNTVIHRPSRKPPSIVQPPLRNFAPHPPGPTPAPAPRAPAGPASPAFNPQPPSPPGKASKQEAPYRPALMRGGPEEDLRPTTRRSLPPSKQAPIYQGRIHPPRQGVSPPDARAPQPPPHGSLAQQAQNQRIPAQISSSSLRQKSPPVGGRQRNEKSSSMDPSRSSDQQRSSGEHQRSSDLPRSSSQASSQDLTSHEMHDEIADQRHPPQTPPESKRRPPLPPQLMPLNQPRLPGSHHTLGAHHILSPSKKERKEKRKKKRREREEPPAPSPSKGYVAPLMPLDGGMMNVKSANIYNRRGEVQSGRVSGEMDRSSEEPMFTIEDAAEKLSHSPGRQPQPSARRSAQKQRTTPPRVRTSVPPPPDDLSPPQVEGHRVSYRRNGPYHPPHLPPPHLNAIHDQQ